MTRDLLKVSRIDDISEIIKRLVIRFERSMREWKYKQLIFLIQFNYKLAQEEISLRRTPAVILIDQAGDV